MSSATSPEPATPRRARRLLPLTLTLLAIAMVGIVGVFASTALLSDEVSLTSIEAHGGTLDLAVETDAAPGTTNLTFGAEGTADIAPGSSRSSTFVVTNTGSVPANFRFVSDAAAASDDHGCFEYSVTKTVGAGVVAPGTFARNVSASLGVLEPGVPHSLQLTVTALETCAVNAAPAQLDAKITALQVGADS